MAFVPRYEHDIFVSYAHVDDQPDPGAEEGWVTTLVKGLRIRLAQIFGRSEAFSLWMDAELAGNTPITPTILDTLQQTATLVIILSPAYLESEWCLREKNRFLPMIGEQVRRESRVFVVERDRVVQGERPPEFGELLGYRFWLADREGKPPRILGVPRPSPNDLRYYDVLNDLSHDLATELRRLREAAGRSGAKAEVSGGREAVFLAEVTDDLDLLREDVKRYLDQAGLRVLPETWYSRDPFAFQGSVDADLSKCTVFVQLLSAVRGKRLPGSTQSYVLLQYEQAKNGGKSILQWRSQELDVTSVTDEDHRALLECDTVLAVGIEEFKHKVVEYASYRPSVLSPGLIKAFVFVSMETEDRSLAETVCDVLGQEGAAYVLPMRQGKPAEIRRDLEQNLLTCDGLIIVYGRTTVAWVREQLRQCCKILPQRQCPLPALAVYEGPPEQKDPLDLRLPNMRMLDCRRGLNQAALKAFLETIQAQRHT
jgi:hypothetical protein